MKGPTQTMVLRLPKSSWHHRFGERLRYARKIAGYDSAAELAKALHQETGERIAGGTVANWERGDREVPLALIPVISEIIHLPLEYWFYDKRGPKSPAGASIRARRFYS